MNLGCSPKSLDQNLILTAGYIRIKKVNSSYPPAPGAFQQLIIEKIREETKNFKTFFFREGHGLHYEAGQFITLIDRTGLQEIRRSYSIVSSPALKEPLAIGVKRLDNGFFSRKLIDRARSGDTLITSGVSGFFKLPENIQSFKNFFFFAAGSGITPVLSLIKTILHVYPDKKIYLSYSSPSVESTAYYHDLKKTERLYPEQLTVNFLFSSATDLRKARLNREFLLEILEVNAADQEKTFFYTCGPPSYMRLVIFLLLEGGYPQEHIKREDFNPGNKKLSLRMPPEKNNYRVKMKLGGSNVDFLVQYPDTILQAAKRIKLILPYSCETGKCGTCAAHCISGKVWHSNNEVLTDQDLAKGLILTCTGYPQSDDLILEID
jgi:ring-1,2-phenylacetyl-CoA epoxidase subunit PaaE